MRRRGQTVFGMSFGVIFSIIIIIFILAVAIYATTYFLGLSNCSKTGLFYDGLQEEIDKAWTSGIYQGTFPLEGNPLELPNGIKKVCLGSLTLSATVNDDELTRRELEDVYFRDIDDDIYFYPPEKACDGDFGSNKLQHENINNFFCVEVNGGEVARIRLDKQTNSETVSISS